jgi:hypothetical protein
MRNSLHPQSGHDITRSSAVPDNRNGRAGSSKINPLATPTLQQQRAELRRATGTVEHHSANARAMATSSPEPPSRNKCALAGCFAKAVSANTMTAAEGSTGG